MENEEIKNEEMQTPIVEAPAEVEKPAACCHHGKGHIVCAHIGMAVMFAAIVVLYILHFTNSSKSLTNPNATPAISGEGGVTVAYINTDTLMAKYQYALDLQKEIEEYQTSKESSYKKQMEQFQQDYNAYLKTGADMTLTQQKAKEEELKGRMERLQNLEGEYTLQIQKKTLEESEKMTKAVYAFIREYNEANSRFDIILSKSFNSSPVLYGNPGMDITEEILEGLNKEYAETRGKDKKAE